MKPSLGHFRWGQQSAGTLARFLQLVDQQWLACAQGREVRDIWFRGQASNLWSLQPGIYRPNIEDGDENAARHEFHLRVHPFINESATYPPRTDWDYYFLMQHYGLPTRLLDWTESALVALYFAVQQGSSASRLSRHSGVVWILDPARLNKVASLSETIYRFDFAGLRRYLRPIWSRAALPKPPVALEAPYNSRRIAAQRGKFTIHGSSALPLDQRNRSSEYLAQIIVPWSAKERIRRQLATAGITESIVFPEMSGLARDIYETRLQQVTVE